MRLIANILWHVPFLGFVNAIYAFLLGVLLTLLVVTAPIGLGLIQYSKYLMLPFTHKMVHVSETERSRNPIWSAYSALIMLIYLPFGVIAWIFGLVQCIGMAVTLVGLPGAYIIFKSLRTYFNPVGMVCVPHSYPN